MEDLTAYLNGLEKKLNAVRSLADEALKDLAKIKEAQGPEEPRKRRNLKQERLDNYALAVASGKWGMKRVSQKLLNQK